MSRTERRVVVVVGAGVAGLSAAARLVQTDQYDVIVLEAGDRYGGRMNTVHFGEGLVELGANWIHGETLTNSIYTLAAQANQLHPYVLLDRMEGYCYTERGETLDPRLVSRLWTLYQNMDTELHKEDRQDEMSYKVWLKNQFDTYIQTLPEGERRPAQCVVSCLLNLESFHDGGYLSDISLGTSTQYTELLGGNVKLPFGVSSLLAPLTGALPPHSLQCNREVTNIRLCSGDNKHPIEIICKSEPRVYADHVIVTCSLGVLKHNHHTLFYPNLPSHKVDAIEKMGFGRVGKVFLYYKTPFWVRGKGGIKFCWSEEEATPRGPEEWFKRIFAFDEVLNNPGVLVGWVSGDEAAHMESLPLQQVALDCSTLIKTFLDSPHLPNPTDVCRSNWSHHPHFLGSYSYMRHTASVIAALRDPICSKDGVPRVLFAGEATHDNYFSTMHGARSSGIREADRLLRLNSGLAKL